MIKNIEIVDFWEQTKFKLYEAIRRTNSIITNVSHIYFMCIQIAISIIFVAFMIDDGIFPKPVVSFFNIIRLSQISETFNVNPLIITIIIFIMSLSTVILIVMHLVFEDVFEQCSQSLAILMKLHQYLLTSLLSYIINLYLKIQSGELSQGAAFYALTIVIELISIVVCMVRIKFQIRFIRKNNNFWNISNEMHFYGALFLTFKCWFVSIYGVNALICLVSIVMWYEHRQIQKACINELQSKIECLMYNFIALTDLAIFVSIATQNQIFAFSIWIISIVLLILYYVLLIYRSGSQDLMMPPCDSPPQEFYSFFYNLDFKEKNQQSYELSEQEKKNLENIYAFHKMICPKNCNFSSNIKISLTSLQHEICSAIDRRKSQSVKNSLINELWLMQSGGKYQIDHLRQKNKTVIQDYIIYCIDAMSRVTQNKLKNIQSLRNSQLKLFYDMIIDICMSYSRLYQEISKANPKADCIVKHGISIIAQVQNIKTTYSHLLRLKMINFKMFQIYIEFFNTFVHEYMFDETSIHLMNNIHKHIDFDDVNENYLPTLTIFPDKAIIQGANGQAQKILQMTRFQIRFKKVSQIFYPDIDLSVINQRISKSQQNEDLSFHSFFKKSESDYAFGKLRIRQKYLKQKMMLVAETEVQHYTSTQNVIFVDDDFNLEIVLRKDMMIKFIEKGHLSTIKMDWQDIFKRFINPSKSLVLSSQVSKIELQNNLILIVKRLKSANLTYNNIFYLQIMKSDVNNKEQKRSSDIFRSSLISNKADHPFQFHYLKGYMQEILKIVGFNKSSSYSTKQMATMKDVDKKFQCNLMEILAQKKLLASEQIKTYRLFQGELYNIDLEDKQAYQQQFQQHIDQNSKINTNDKNNYFHYFIIVVFAMGICLIGFSISFFANVTQVKQDLKVTYAKYIKIHSFQINTNRILGLLRDYQLNLTNSIPNFDVKKQILDTYADIGDYKAQNIFSTLRYSLKTKNKTLNGNLYELTEAMKSSIMQFLETKNTTLLNDLCQAYYKSYHTNFKANRKILQFKITQDFQSIKNKNFNMIIWSSIFILVLYLVMIVFCFYINSRSKEKLAVMLTISDNQSKNQKQNAEKMKFVIQMALKNVQFDIKSELNEYKHYKRRQKPKDSTLSKEIVVFLAFLIILGLVNHSTVFLVSNTQIDEKLINLQYIRQQSHNALSVYVYSSLYANKFYFTNKIDVKDYNYLRKQIQEVSVGFQQLSVFNPKLLSEIQTFFFYDSCELMKLKTNLSQQKCRVALPGYTIQNPFDMGFFTYAQRQIFYLTSNLTQNFAHTGIYSKELTKIHLYFAQQLQTQGVELIQKSLYIVQFLSIYIIFVDCLYIAIFLAIYRYFNNQYTKIKEISNFFKVKQPNLEKENLKQSKKINTSKDQQQGQDKSIKSQEEQSLISN